MNSSEWILMLIKNNNLRVFYKSARWKRKRASVLKQQNGECQVCKAAGKVRRADTVHHVHTVRRRPDLALSEVDEQGNINLLAVCASCHWEIHHSKKETTPERW